LEDLVDVIPEKAVGDLFDSSSVEALFNKVVNHHLIGKHDDARFPNALPVVIRRIRL